MIDKPLNQLNAFFNLTQERTICGSDQLLYLHLFNRFNKAHWTQSMSIPDRELITAMRLYESSGKPVGVNTLYRSRSRLKSAGLINFKSGKGSDCTEYELIQLYPVDTPVDTPADTLPPSQKNYTREDVKDEEDVKKEIKKIARASGISEEVLKTWQDCEGVKLNGAQLLDLHNQEILYGTEKIVKTIKFATLSCNAEQFPNLMYSYFKKILENPKNQQKGVTKNAGNGKTVKRGANTGSPEDWEQRRPDWLND